MENMNDEEKKAIKEVKHFNQLTRYWQEEEYEEKEIAEYITTILNLIEKQTKEIEELKEKNKELNKYIEDRAKIGKNIQTFINKDYVEQEYISKDKIKAKIEELEKEIITGAKKTDIIRRAIIYELQSLLEKE